MTYVTHARIPSWLLNYALFMMRLVTALFKHCSYDQLIVQVPTATALLTFAGEACHQFALPLFFIGIVLFAYFVNYKPLASVVGPSKWLLLLPRNSC